jgi:hypothetical protein
MHFDSNWNFFVEFKEKFENRWGLKKPHFSLTCFFQWSIFLYK